MHNPEGDNPLPIGERLDPNTSYLLRKFGEFEQAHDLTVGQLTSRISFLEKRIRDLEMKHAALVQAVYSNEAKRK